MYPLSELNDFGSVLLNLFALLLGLVWRTAEVSFEALVKVKVEVKVEVSVWIPNGQTTEIGAVA